MTAPLDPQRFLILLRDADSNQADAGPVIIRLRRALKVLLRSFGLRCVSAESFPTPPTGSAPDAVGKGLAIDAELTRDLSKG